MNDEINCILVNFEYESIINAHLSNRRYNQFINQAVCQLQSRCGLTYLFPWPAHAHLIYVIVHNFGLHLLPLFIVVVIEYYLTAFCHSFSTLAWPARQLTALLFSLV